MKVWTIANQKGGVGKTTTAVALGGLLAQLGKRTLLLDIDPHGSLTSYFRYDPDVLDDSVYNLFKAVADKKTTDPIKLLYQTGTVGLELMPAVMALATLDRQASRLEGMGLVLKNALRELEEKFDYVLIDCPPMLGVLMVNALAACDRLIIPVQTEFLALKGLERMMQTLSMILRARHIELPYTIVPTMFDQRTRASVDSLRVLRETYSDHLWADMIPIDTQLREASKAGIPPAQYNANTHGVLAYGRLLDSLLESDRMPHQLDVQP
ncbi:MAG: ParA family protein [Candidatus Polarisedimenticolaceae bacterium]|nr:ParA family protein [Candidatus Polarisedimenticolaceae bacterium]